MKVLTDTYDLIGKTIKYVNTSHDDEGILTIVTEDDCILHSKYSAHGYEDRYVEFEVETNKLNIYQELEKTMDCQSIFTEDEINKFNEEIEATRKASQARTDEWNRKRDLAQLEKLKAKYENN